MDFAEAERGKKGEDFIGDDGKDFEDDDEDEVSSARGEEEEEEGEDEMGEEEAEEEEEDDDGEAGVDTQLTFFVGREEGGASPRVIGLEVKAEVEATFFDSALSTSFDDGPKGGLAVVEVGVVLVATFSLGESVKDLAFSAGELAFFSGVAFGFNGGLVANDEPGLEMGFLVGDFSFLTTLVGFGSCDWKLSSDGAP